MNNEICKNCKYFDNKLSYPGTGYCRLILDYVKENDDCEDFDEREN